MVLARLTYNCDRCKLLGKLRVTT